MTIYIKNGIIILLKNERNPQDIKYVGDSHLQYITRRWEKGMREERVLMVKERKEYYFDVKDVLRTRDYYANGESKLKENFQYWADFFKVDVDVIKKAVTLLEPGYTLYKFKVIVKNVNSGYEEDTKQVTPKEISVQDFIGICKFEYEYKGSGSNKVLDCIRVNFLVQEEYSFEDVKKVQKGILKEVVKRLETDKMFSKIGIPVGAFKARMFYKKTPKSITIIFTLKDTLTDN